MAGFRAVWALGLAIFGLTLRCADDELRNALRISSIECLIGLLVGGCCWFDWLACCAKALPPKTTIAALNAAANSGGPKNFKFLITLSPRIVTCTTSTFLS
jgi:hypothetical protein